MRYLRVVPFILVLASSLLCVFPSIGEAEESFLGEVAIEFPPESLEELDELVKLLAIIPPQSQGHRSSGEEPPKVTTNGTTTTVTFKLDGYTYTVRHNTRTGKTTIKKKKGLVTFTYTIECTAQGECTVKDFFGNTVCTYVRGSDGNQSAALGSCSIFGEQFDFVIFVNTETGEVCYRGPNSSECININDLFRENDREPVREMLREMFPTTPEEKTQQMDSAILLR